LQLNLRCLAFLSGLETCDFLIFDFFLKKLQKKDQFYQKNKIKILLITLKISIFNSCLTRKKPHRKVGTWRLFKKKLYETTTLGSNRRPGRLVSISHLFTMTYVYLGFGYLKQK